MFKSSGIALALLVSVALWPSVVQAQDIQIDAIKSQSKLFDNISQNLGWADLATACRIRSEGWNKLIHDKATYSIFIEDELLHLNGRSRDLVGNTIHDEAADIGKANSCAKVSPQILRWLDKVAVTP